MDDIVVVKAAHNLNDGVCFADIREELVAQTLALRSTPNEARDIEKLDHCGHYFLSFVQLFENGEAFVGDGHDADVWLDGREWIICRQCRFLSDQCIKKCRFSDVGQANDSCL